MIESIIIVAVVIIVGVNILTTVSTRFRRWLYKDVKWTRNRYYIENDSFDIIYHTGKAVSFNEMLKAMLWTRNIVEKIKLPKKNI